MAAREDTVRVTGRSWWEMNVVQIDEEKGIAKRTWDLSKGKKGFPDVQL